MKTILVSLTFILCINVYAQDKTVTISGQVTDFEGKPIDSCMVQILHANFTPAYQTYSDKSGFYSIPDVEKGNYAAMLAICPQEYPRPIYVSADKVVPDEDKRLEFWAWNIIADKDLTINPRYDRLELYGFTVFAIQGGYPGLMAYIRPMSLGKLLSYEQKKWKDKNIADKVIDLSINQDSIAFNVYAEDEPLKINLVQRIQEYVGGGTQYAYLLQFDRPKKQFDNYCIFRIEATHNAYGGEKGENIYFYELKNYK